MSDLEATVASLKATQRAQGEAIEKIETRIDGHLTKIYDKLDTLSTTFHRRPAWSVVVIITALSSGFFTMLALFLGKAG